MRLIDGDEAVRVLEELRRSRRAQGEGYEEPYAHMGYINISVGVEHAIAALRALPDATPCRGCAYAYKPYAQLAVERAEEEMR